MLPKQLRASVGISDDVPKLSGKLTRIERVHFLVLGHKCLTTKVPLICVAQPSWKCGSWDTRSRPAKALTGVVPRKLMALANEILTYLVLDDLGCEIPRLEAHDIHRETSTSVRSCPNVRPEAALEGRGLTLANLENLIRLGISKQVDEAVVIARKARLPPRTSEIDRLVGVCPQHGRRSSTSDSFPSRHRTASRDGAATEGPDRVGSRTRHSNEDRDGRSDQRNEWIPIPWTR